MATAEQVLKPDRILKELSELWISMGKPVAGEGPGEGGVLRACAMTLITIVDEDEDSSALGETLAMLMRDHPSRAIVIRLSKDPSVLEGRVFAQCWMPFGHRRQICCEQVEITVSASRLEDIPGIVGPLAVPDLPRNVWLRCSALRDSPMMNRLLRLGDRVIVDSSRKGAIGLDGIRAIVDRGDLVGDLAWTRLTEVRELIAQILEGKDPQTLKHPSVSYCGEQPSTETRYLAGWLQSIFPEEKVALTKVEGEGGIREVRIEPGIRVKLSDACANFEVGELREWASFRTGSDYELLNEELRITRHDHVFERVLRQIT